MPGFFAFDIRFLNARPGAEQCQIPPDSLALIGSYIGSLLDSADHGRQIFFEIYEMVFPEQDRRSAGLARLDHQDLVEIYQDFPRRRSRSFEYDKISHISPQWFRNGTQLHNDYK